MNTSAGLQNQLRGGCAKTDSFEVCDVFGQVVQLPAARWHTHILATHPEVGPYLAEIRDAVADPNCVYGSEMDPDAKLSYDVVSVEPEDGVVLRLDANTDEMVGYTVLDYERRFAGIPADEARLPLVPEFALLPLRSQLRLLRNAELAAGA